MVQAPGACTLKHYGFEMYGLSSKLVCLLFQANVCLPKLEDISLLRNLSVSRKLRVRNVL
jgi:hypothetical protein